MSASLLEIVDLGNGEIVLQRADDDAAPLVMVGGAPTSPEWASEIGAHHAENALAAVSRAAELLGR